MQHQMNLSTEGNYENIKTYLEMIISFNILLYEWMCRLFILNIKL